VLNLRPAEKQGKNLTKKLTPLERVKATLLQKRIRVHYGIISLAKQGDMKNHTTVGMIIRLRHELSSEIYGDLDSAKLEIFDVHEDWGNNNWTPCQYYHEGKLDRDLAKLCTKEEAMKMVAEALCEACEED